MKKLIIALVLLAVITGLGTFAVLNVVDWLKGEDKPVPAKAIMILSGPPSRALYAADLYKQGYAKEIYITRPEREPYFQLTDDLGVYFPRTEKMQKDVLLKKGVTEKAIHIVGNDCKSTVDEAEIAAGIFKGDNCNILVVSSPYHVRRAQMIFKAKMKHCRYVILGTPYESFATKWWTDQDSARNVLLEVAKIIHYKLGGRFRSVDKGAKARGE